MVWPAATDAASGVKSYLVSRGVASERIDVAGHLDDEPSGARNRAVEIVVTER